MVRSVSHHPSEAGTLLVTGLRDDMVHGNLATHLAEALDEPIDCATFEEIEFVIGDELEVLWQGRNLLDYNYVIIYGNIKKLLRLSHPLAVTLRHLEQDSFTSGAENFKGVDKLAQNVYFATMGVPVPKTYFAEPKTLIAEAGRVIGFPLILKDILVSRGERNYLIHTQEELEGKFTEMNEHRFIAQEYIENDGDLRVLVNDDNEMFAFHRAASGENHLNNTSQGAAVQPLEKIPKELANYCQTIIRSLNMPILGIDVIKRGQSYYFLEANTQPMIFTGYDEQRKRDIFISQLRKSIEKKSKK